jgi:hypothetical protein
MKFEPEGGAVGSDTVAPVRRLSITLLGSGLPTGDNGFHPEHPALQTTGGER